MVGGTVLLEEAENLAVGLTMDDLKVDGQTVAGLTVVLVAD